jgi:general secretion pathway protein J
VKTGGLHTVPVRRRASGFTLLEVMIALAIFSIIAIGTVRHIQQLQNTKVVAFNELDLYDNLRAALSLMRFDLSQAFHVQYDDLGSEAKLAVMQNQPVAHTLFDGRKKELVFTSASHRVYYSGVRESEQTEISYFLQNRQGVKFPSLMKRESGFIDADLYQGGSIYTVLDNVSSLDFFYWDEKNGKWVDDWNSDNGDFRDRFPQAVKIKISIVGNSGEELKLQSEFKIANPNNDPLLVQF